MARVYVPHALKPICEQRDFIDVVAGSVREAIDRLEEQYPGVRPRLCRADRLMPGMAVSVNGAASSLGLLQPLKPDDEVHFLPAIGGG